MKTLELSLPRAYNFMGVSKNGRKSIGMAFLVKSKSKNVKITSEVLDYRWISSLEELKQYNCIPGIYNHFVLANKKLKSMQFDTFDNIQLTENKYLNK